MLVAFIMSMEHYRLYQKMEGVLDQRGIRYILPSQIKSYYDYLKQKMEKHLNEPIVIYSDDENAH